MSLIVCVIVAACVLGSTSQIAQAQQVVKLQPELARKELARKVDNTSGLNLGVFSLGFLNSACTGAQITKLGHVLLANHCIQPSVSWARAKGQHLGRTAQSFRQVRAISVRDLKSKPHFRMRRIYTEHSQISVIRMVETLLLY